MTHPLIPEILDLAEPIAAELGLEVVEAVFQTNRKPPILRVDVRNLTGDTGLNDCEQMSHALEARLDASDLIPGSYVLEISSPGISRQLLGDREFAAFKGFAAIVTTSEPYQGHSQWRGRLQGRDETAVYLNDKGRHLAIPRSLVDKVQLDDQR
ncbi:MAG: ribosome maturation factor RimP [Chloroflexaceae bacterium]|nr:ribosome maturation factor RimP [Chloroflexaceae bacterium]